MAREGGQEGEGQRGGEIPYTFGGGMARETGRVDKKERGKGEGRFLHVWRGMVRETGRVDKKERGKGEGRFLHVWRGDGEGDREGGQEGEGHREGEISTRLEGR